MSTRIIRLNETNSTNIFLKEYKAEADTTSICTVAVTEYQTAGKGQGCNTWESEAGKNLLFSILFHPTYVKADAQFIISMTISNAIRRVLSSATGEEITIKWPNDIYHGDRKLCGILIENSLSGSTIKDCIIGIGINVNQSVFRSDAPNPVSLRLISGKEFDRDFILDAILNEFTDMMRQIEEDTLYIYNNVSEEYMLHLYHRNGYHHYRDSNGLFKAEIEGVDGSGHLQLKDETGRKRRYAFKEVEFVIQE